MPLQIPKLPVTIVAIAVFNVPICDSGEAQEIPAAAERIIEKLALSESERPIREHPRWREPEKIAMLIPRSVENTASGLSDEIRRAAGSTEVVLISRSEALDGLGDVDAFIGYCDPGILTTLNELRWIHSYGVGVERCTRWARIDNYDFILTNNQRLSGPDIAEHSIALIMALAKRLPHYQQLQSEQRWQRGSYGDSRAVNVDGKTLLILGLGGIGTETARRAAALGMRVTATRNSSRDGPEFVDYVGLSDEMYELAATADFIVNALPLTDATAGLIDRKFFTAAKAGAHYVSVGRGKTTVTTDLVDALKSGRLAGAALDVTDPEPLPAKHELWTLNNVIITPHVAAATPEARLRTLTIAIENLRRYVQGDKLLSVVDLQRGY